MNLKQRIQQDLKKALKEKDESRVSILRMLVDLIVKKEKEKRFALKEELSEQKLQEETQATDQEVLQLISTLLKRAKESIEQFQAGDRPDLAEKEEKEIQVLASYMPEQLTEAEIRVMVQEVIRETGAQSPQDIGMVMSGIMPKVKGRADGNLVNKLVKELLS